MTSPQDRYSPRLDLLALLLIAASFAVRYWFVASGQLNLVQDEAQYWDWIRRPQLSYYSKGPLIAWMIAAWTQIFGNTELGVRFGSILGMTGIQAALYVGVSRVWREYRLAIFVLFVAATMPLLNGLGILATTDNPLIFCWTVAFFALAAATRNEPDYTPSDWPFVILAVCVAMGTLAKYMMLAFLGLGLVYALILHFRGQLPPRFWWRFLLASLIGSIIGLAPIVAWNIDNDWVAYKHVAKLSTGVGNSKALSLRIGPFFEMLGAQIGLLAPWWFLAIMAGTRTAWKKSWLGPIGRFDAVYRRDLLSMLFFWPLWGILTFKALVSKVEANWTAAAFMGGALLGGMALKQWWEAPTRKPRGKVILATLALIMTGIIFASPLAPVPDDLNPTHRLKGWSNLGLKVDELMRTEFDNPAKVFAMSDNYGFTSELAFYLPGQPITYCSWTEPRRMNQYDLWPSPAADKIGWDAVMVRKRFQPNPVPDLSKMFESVSEPIFYESSFREGSGRKFTIILCKGFTGYWPQRGLGRY
ncbi:MULTISPECIES: glycosyltransferase family 39 protein [unclassified Pseudodesulfovibrio]|uniref:ArnT family glycosyltransferase n=1 Tax=unclassified Pseudodesulfovibrio TaxID=2661612 RepID=UPI000FEB9601|nr:MULTISPECIES: glycosyltransferase family 39 protein [unclassified Pseudodesulfovibrio]MCJ2164597.1 glycosyltransferase family 39 protein [Pseudodesulfovibrio sp. S3-i]RWU04243.1 phospholipid carrier-dependent glycosyltransferase [Pseudodesulfovibrio sp. S3]